MSADGICASIKEAGWCAALSFVCDWKGERERKKEDFVWARKWLWEGTNAVQSIRQAGKNLMSWTFCANKLENKLGAGLCVLKSPNAVLFIWRLCEEYYGNEQHLRREHKNFEASKSTLKQESQLFSTAAILSSIPLCVCGLPVIKL